MRYRQSGDKTVNSLRQRIKLAVTGGCRAAGFWALAAVIGAPPLPAAAAAAEPPACATVRLAETGWTDIAAATALTRQILQALGYKTQTRLLSVPVTFSAMATGEIDIFLGFWQPTMTADIRPYRERGEVQIIRENLRGARYGLAVPDYTYAAGLRTLADIARFGAALHYKIYGIEPGNDANRLVLAGIEADKDGLGAFRLVESSEPAMLAELGAAIAEHKPIVFLAWQPHPMNQQFHIAYLQGGEAWFGAGGGASVATVTRRDYSRECPNIGRFLQNLSFSLTIENTVMDKILRYGDDPDSAARAWLGRNPPELAAWLAGVTSRSGAAALPIVQKAFAPR